MYVIAKLWHTGLQGSLRNKNHRFNSSCQKSFLLYNLSAVSANSKKKERMKDLICLEFK